MTALFDLTVFWWKAVKFPFFLKGGNSLASLQLQSISFFSPILIILYFGTFVAVVFE